MLDNQFIYLFARARPFAISLNNPETNVKRYNALEKGLVLKISMGFNIFIIQTFSNKLCNHSSLLIVTDQQIFVNILLNYV